MGAIHKLKLHFTGRVILPVLMWYQRLLGRIIEPRRCKLRQRFLNFYGGEEPDYKGREYQSILKSSGRIDRLSQHELRLEQRIEALDIRITALLLAWDQQPEEQRPYTDDMGNRPDAAKPPHLANESHRCGQGDEKGE